MSRRKDLIDRLYETRPVATLEVYLQLVGGELFELCQRFPPAPEQIQFDSPRMRDRFTPLLDRMSAPSAELMLVLTELLDWEIDHEIERVDQFMRSESYSAVVHSDLELESMHLLRHLLLETLLGRKESSSHKIKRQELHQAVETFRGLCRQLD